MLFNVKQSKVSLYYSAFLMQFLIKVSFAKHISKNDTDNDQKAMRRVTFSYPGTKWCGPGNTAAHDEDFGRYERVDKCCRSHDHCDNIPSGEEKNGLTNDDTFTKLHCKCDKKFKRCLKRINSLLSNQIGTIYFSIRKKCYKKQHPVVSCSKKESRILLDRCVEYKVDMSQPKIYQWFDMPFYSSNYTF